MTPASLMNRMKREPQMKVKQNLNSRTLTMKIRAPFTGMPASLRSATKSAVKRALTSRDRLNVASGAQDGTLPPSKRNKRNKERNRSQHCTK